MKPMMNIICAPLAAVILAIGALTVGGIPAVAQQVRPAPTPRPRPVRLIVITSFDYPGNVTSTQPQKINDSNDIVGTYVDSSGVVRGFIRFANGNFSAPIVDPNDSCGVTIGRGFNNSLLICGSYENGDCANPTLHGFFLMGNNFSDFNVSGFPNTEVLGVNNVGDFAGSVTDTTGVGPAFVSLGGTITTFNVPGARGAAAYQLNSSNQLEGYYEDSSGGFHAFYRDADGTLHFPIDYPGSILTLLVGNNDSNWMVGRYVDSAGRTHGLFFVPPNRFVGFDYPGSTFTSLNGINAQGFTCGRYADAAGIQHGIIVRVTGL